MLQGSTGKPKCVVQTQRGNQTLFKDDKIDVSILESLALELYSPDVYNFLYVQDVTLVFPQDFPSPDHVRSCPVVT